jgi:L-fuculose-phosphate aldolase
MTDDQRGGHTSSSLIPRPSSLTAWLPAFRAAGEDLFACGLIVPGSGNLSVWTPEGVLITREGAALHRLEPADLVLIARVTEPPVATPSMDTPIHRAIYVSAAAKAVVHAHPRHVVARSFKQAAFRPPDLEGGHLLGRVPVVSPRRNVVQLVAEALAEAPAVIVEGHGTYARGTTLSEAVHVSAILEESARIAWLRRGLSGTSGDTPA